MRVIKSRLLGYCHGVSETITKASKCINRAEQLNLPCYSIGSLIHNNDVVKYFEEKGLKVINSPDCEPGVALVRAHGISEKSRKEFEGKGFILVDLTCSNILKTKQGMKNAFAAGRKVVLIGSPDHAEIKGLLDTVPVTLVSDELQAQNLCKTDSPDSEISIFTQTTFDSVLYRKIIFILNGHFKNIEIGSKLCQACSARKNCAVELCSECDVVVVVGSPASHNTMDLARTIEAKGNKVLCVENRDSFSPELDLLVSSFKTAGVCSGTSTPKYIIDGVVEHLESL